MSETANQSAIKIHEICCSVAEKMQNSLQSVIRSCCKICLLVKGKFCEIPQSVLRKRKMQNLSMEC